MRFFLIITLLGSILLGVTVQRGLPKGPAPKKKTFAFLVNYREKMKDNFEKRENANILFSFITGDKAGISPYTKNAFKRMNLSYLLSPSSIHLSAIILYLSFLFRKKRYARLFSGMFFISFDSLKRLFFFRIFRFKLTTERTFFAVFILSFLLGDYAKSPLSFVYSFLFLGTFLGVRDYSKLTLIAALFSTQLIIALFMGEKVSLLSIPAGLFGSFIFSLLFPILLLFLLSFWIIPLNWGEPLLNAYVKSIHVLSKLLTGSFTSSSLFLILSVWVILYGKWTRKYLLLFSITLFLHSNTAMTPSIFNR